MRRRFYRLSEQNEQAYLHQLCMSPNDRSSVRADALAAAEHLADVDPPYADLEAWERDARASDLDSILLDEPAVNGRLNPPHALQERWKEMCMHNKFRTVKDQIREEMDIHTPTTTTESLEYTIETTPWVWYVVQCAALYNAVWFIRFIHAHDPDLFERGSERGLQVSTGFELEEMEGLFAYACMKTGNVEMVEYLLEAGCDPNEPNCGGTPLFLAAKKGDLHMMVALLRAGATSHPMRGFTTGVGTDLYYRLLWGAHPCRPGIHMKIS